jgi:cobalt-zinc-cadmium efflux system outer membrane protein
MKFIFLSCFLFIFNANAQNLNVIDGTKYRPLSLDAYLEQVESNSGAIVAKKLSLDSIKAQRPYMVTPNINPSLTYSRGAYYSQVPYTPYVSPNSDTVSLSGTIEGWGKRTARSNYSAAQIQSTQADVDSTVKSIRADAAFAYFDTLRIKKLFDSYQDAIKKLELIKDSAGVASLKEAQKNTANDLKYFSYTMGIYSNNEANDLIAPLGNLNKIKTVDFKSKDLIDRALTQRADILYFKEAIKTAAASLELAKKNRNINLSPTVWVSQTPSYESSGTQYGMTQAYGFSLSIPIPTNLLFDGDLIQEANNKTTLEAYLRDLNGRIIAEVSQGLMQYNFAKTKLIDTEKSYANSVKQYQTRNAKSIIYLREQEAQLIDAEINHAKALIYLQRVSGDYELPKI